jgi:hypothetical protein
VESVSPVYWRRGESTLHPLSVADGRVVQQNGPRALLDGFEHEGRMRPNERPMTYTGFFVHPNTRPTRLVSSRACVLSPGTFRDELLPISRVADGLR